VFLRGSLIFAEGMCTKAKQTEYIHVRHAFYVVFGKEKHSCGVRRQFEYCVHDMLGIVCYMCVRARE